MPRKVAPSLFVRLTVLFAVATALPLAGSAWFLLRSAGQWAEAEAERRGAAVAEFAENLLLSTVERAEIKLATLARMTQGSALTTEYSRLLEAQVEPPDVFLELQSFDTAFEVNVNSQVQQRALGPDSEADRRRALSNALDLAVQAPLATKRPWRSEKFERLRDAATLAVSAPNLIGDEVRGVLVGYIDFRELRASLERAGAQKCRIVVRDGAGNVLADAGEVVPDPRSTERDIAGTPWRVEVRESRARIAGPLDALERQLLAWAGLGIALALAAGALLASRIARPVAQLET